MTSQLFRKEAVEHHGQRLYGEVVLTAPFATWVLTAVVSAVFVICILTLMFGSYGRKESALGWLVPSAGLTRVYPSEVGVIDAVFVEEGTTVTAGQPLFSMRFDDQISGGQTMAATVLGQMTLEEAELNRRREATRLRYDLRAKELNGQREDLSAEIAQLERQIGLQDERVELARKQIAQIEELVSRGVVSVIEKQRREENLLAHRQAGEEKRSQSLSLRNQIRRLDFEVAKISVDEAADIASLDEARAGLNQRRAQFDRRQSAIVSAPVAGRVTSVLARHGAHAQANDLQLIILPERSDLIAEVFVPTAASGFIQEGIELRIMYDAFPFQKFGVGSGFISNVSHAVLAADEVSAPLQVTGPVYRVLAAVEELPAQGGSTTTLRAGMTFRADIIIERRKLWEWLAEPLLAAWRR